MTKISFLLFLITSFANTLPVSISKAEYNSGDKSSEYFFDSNVKKKNGILSYTNYKALKDSHNDENFYEYEYLGDIDEAKTVKVIRKVFYNGYGYLLIDTKNSGRIYHFSGKPLKFGSLLMCANEHATTDNKSFVEIWKVRSNFIEKIKTIPLKFDPNEIKISSKHELLFKDFSFKFWRLNLDIPNSVWE